MESFQKREHERRKAQRRVEKEARRMARVESRQLPTVPPAGPAVAGEAEPPLSDRPEGGLHVGGSHP